ncbi:MAG: VCBS repeat-containing protein [Phycisphaerae bacterium]|nr:VCBS repeat-containing protein [Phycisphaerae bacterium]
MPSRRSTKLLVFMASSLAITAAVSCVEEARPWFLGGTLGLTDEAGRVIAAPGEDLFTEMLILERTFVQGKVVTTATYRVADMNRTPLQIDFNRDGRIDPVVGYDQGGLGIVQILISYEDEQGAPQFASLTLDGGENLWTDLKDVAAGDIDGDGALDIVVATREGVIYLHHPDNPDRTHILSEWGRESGELEIIEGTSEALTAEELEAIVTETLGTSVDSGDYIVTVDEGYTNVEIADFDNDGDNDIVASRQMEITLVPKPDYPGEPLSIVAGSIQLLLNPGGATSGELWLGVPIGLHERHDTFDREGAGDLSVQDLDGDGDLDLISTAVDDQNAQVSWFENPGGPGSVDPLTPWTQRRIGSIRGAPAIDVADLTGDGRVDVVAVSPLQMQMLLFVQPEAGAGRGYDWYTAPIVTFESYEPRAVKALDLDNDGTLELVVGGTTGAVRYFEPPVNPTEEWEGTVILTYDPPGEVGLLGYGDLDGDGDADLVTVVGSSEDVTANRVGWIRNELVH